jgi:uncharacterized OB-fold protein
MPERRPDRVVGAPHDEFWAFCQREKLCLQRCQQCGHTAWPVVEVCERCGREQLAWIEMSGRGTIASWSTFVRPYYRDVLPVPWDTILVELEEGPLFVSNPLGFTNDDIRVGMPVRVAFIDCEDRTGPFKLPVFEALA